MRAISVALPGTVMTFVVKSIVTGNPEAAPAYEATISAKDPPKIACRMRRTSHGRVHDVGSGPLPRSGHNGIFATFSAQPKSCTRTSTQQAVRGVMTGG